MPLPYHARELRTLGSVFSSNMIRFFPSLWQRLLCSRAESVRPVVSVLVSFTGVQHGTWMAARARCSWQQTAMDQDEHGSADVESVLGITQSLAVKVL
jgi:hypothetical protein